MLYLPYSVQLVPHPVLHIFQMLFTAVEKKDILRKKYPYNCFMMTMYQTLLRDSVSTFLCTRNLGPEEVSVNPV